MATSGCRSCRAKAGTAARWRRRQVCVYSARCAFTFATSCGQPSPQRPVRCLRHLTVSESTEQPRRQLPHPQSAGCGSRVARLCARQPSPPPPPPPLATAPAGMEAGHAVDSFGGAEDVLFAQEVKLEELQGENRCAGLDAHRCRIGDGHHCLEQAQVEHVLPSTLAACPAECWAPLWKRSRTSCGRQRGGQRRPPSGPLMQKPSCTPRRPAPLRMLSASRRRRRRCSG